MKTSTNTPRTAPPSPFFRPSTPHVVVVRQSPGGTRRQVEETTVDEHKSGMVGCTANLVNAIVGSGIVGIPYAVKQAGFGAGVFLVLFIALVTEKSLRLLINTAKHVHCPTYETAMEAAFGVAGFRFVAINMFIVAYGAMLSYLMIVKDNFSMMVRIDEDNVLMKRAVLLLVSLSIMVPISCQRDMADLAKTSRLNVVIDTILVALVAINAPMGESLEKVGGWSTLLTSDVIHFETIFVGVGVLSFAFVCQHSAFIIAGSLDRPTVPRWGMTTRSALLLCAVLATTSGVSGYVGYMHNTEGNILNNLDPKSWSANVARGMLGFTMLFVYPLESFVARHVLVVLLFSGRRAHEGEDSTILNRRDRRIGLTVALYLSAVIPALLFEDLGSVLALTGAVGGSCLSYIGTGVIFLGIHGGRFLELVKESWLGSVLVEPEDKILVKDSLAEQQTTAVETTPLVATKTEAMDIVNASEKGKQEKAEAVEGEFILMTLLKKLVWCLTGMPVWVWIASVGKSGLTAHIHDMALKTPHPIRIGDVVYKRAALNHAGRVEADPEQASVLAPPGRRVSFDDTQPVLAAPNLEGGLKVVTPKRGHGPINEQIGKNILAKQKQKELEPDPQEEPPSRMDFGIAIFYILFGVLALAAGVVSLAEE